jgi:hypothetical protein
MEKKDELHGHKPNLSKSFERRYLFVTIFDGILSVAGVISIEGLPRHLSSVFEWQTPRKHLFN